MGPEAVAAIIGAVSGGGIAIVGQTVAAAITQSRKRRVAAQLVFAELTLGLAEAQSALATRGLWPNTRGAPRTSAWESYGEHLLRGRGVEHVGRLAHAYSALEDIAWLASNDHIDPNENYAYLIDAIRDGLHAVAQMAGMSRAELNRRLAAIDEQNAAFRETLRRDFPHLRDGDDAHQA